MISWTDAVALLGAGAMSSWRLAAVSGHFVPHAVDEFVPLQLDGGKLGHSSMVSGSLGRACAHLTAGQRLTARLARECACGHAPLCGPCASAQGTPGGWHACRHGAARDLSDSGATLAQVLRAGRWRSGAFLFLPPQEGQ